MLGALAMKWKWRARREAAKKPTEKPNLIFGGDVHVVWEKFCRYFDVEPRIVPLQEDKLVIGPEDVEPHIDENTIGVAAVLGTTFTGHADDIVGINKLLLESQGEAGARHPPARRRRQRRVRLAVPLPRLGVGLPPRAGPLDQRLGPQVRPRLSGDRLADLPQPRRAARRPRLLRGLPGQARRHLHPQLLHRLGDGAGAVLQLHPLRALRLPLPDGDDAAERRAARRAASRGSGRSSWSARGRAAAAGGLPPQGRAALRRVRPRLAARRRAGLDGARVPPAAGRGQGEADAGAGEADPDPLPRAESWATTWTTRARCSRRRAGVHPDERKRVHTGTGYYHAGSRRYDGRQPGEADLAPPLVQATKRASDLTSRLALQV